ncbi:MAG: hypothetical protein ABIQ04_02180 [Candidatus Saccharimonadales bacterium]
MSEKLYITPEPGKTVLVENPETNVISVENMTGRSYSPTNNGGDYLIEVGTPYERNKGAILSVDAAHEMSHELLTDAYQAHLAEQLSGLSGKEPFYLPPEHVRSMRMNLGNGKVLDYNHIGYIKRSNGDRGSIIQHTDENGRLHTEKAELLFADPMYEYIDDIEITRSRKIGLSVLDKVKVEAPSTHEIAKNPRLQKLFEPFVRSDNSREKQIQYDRFVDEDTKLIAEDRLKRTVMYEDGLRAILESHAHSEITASTVDALREDANLRYEVGVYFIDKINRLVKSDGAIKEYGFGDRIIRNGQKNPNARTIPVPITSREWSAALALSMIDGTFNGLHGGKNDTVEYNDNNQAIQGQHRDAAYTLLQTR